MRIPIREKPAPFPVFLAGWFPAVLALFLYGLFLPEDWEQCFGPFARPISLAARMPLIEGLAAAADMPGAIVSGFFGLLVWPAPLVGLHLFLCSYDRHSYAFARAERQSPQGPDILHVLRTLGIGCGCLAFLMIALVVIPFFDPEFLLENDFWMGLIGIVMLADRFRLALWGGTLVLSLYALFFWIAFLLPTQCWVMLTGKPPWPLQAPDDAKTHAARQQPCRIRTPPSPALKDRHPVKTDGRDAPAPRRRLTLIHDIGFRNLPRRNRNRVGRGIVAFIGVLVALFAATALPLPARVFGVSASVFACLPPLFALYLFFWGNIVSLENGGTGLAVHWSPPSVEDAPVGLISRLVGSCIVLFFWCLCLFSALAPPLLAPPLFCSPWHPGSLLSAARDALGPDDPVNRLTAACVNAPVFFFGFCAWYGLLVCPVKLWALATGREPSREQKQRILRESGLWTMEKNGELRRVDHDDQDFQANMKNVNACEYLHS